MPFGGTILSCLTADVMLLTLLGNVMLLLAVLQCCFCSWLYLPCLLIVHCATVDLFAGAL